jgi:hypothetical protein
VKFTKGIVVEVFSSEVIIVDFEKSQQQNKKASVRKLKAVRK